MMSEMQADVTAARRALQAVIEAAGEAVIFMNEVDKSLNLRIGTLPASALTEQAIVDALKADPSMAGRVIAGVAFRISPGANREISDVVKAWTLDVGGAPSTRRACVQSLAVALAAASYWG